MKKINLCVFALCVLFVAPVIAQDEDELNRSVTVERDFQPVIQDAGKIATKPSVVETTIDPEPVEFSITNYEYPIATYQAPTLLSQPTRFEPAKQYHGYVRGALGHPNTLFDFGYHLDDGKKSILDVYAHHKAQWGLTTLSKTKIGLDFTHPFSACSLYFGVNGGNVFYYRYGHFYDYSAEHGMWEKNKIAYSNRPEEIENMHKTSLWTAEAYFGVKSNPKEETQYLVQTGYMLFAQIGDVAEHQIRTRAMFDWHSNEHHVGTHLYVQNNFLQLSGLAEQIPDSLYNSRHNFRIEPYYEYKGNRARVHVGVNLDFNIGRGTNALSATEGITFAPSPHINMEAQIAKSWLTIYADVTGNHGFGSLQNYMENNRYRLVHPGIISHHQGSYTPVDAEIGFHIRPHRDLLFEIHGGYAYMMDKLTLIANTHEGSSYIALGTPMMAGDFAYTYSNYGRGKVGGQMNYHYRDMVRINLHGDYYFWSCFEHEAVRYAFENPDPALAEIADSKTVYDRPNWTLGLRIDGKIDKHWSLYSDNAFMGSRLALATDGEHLLSPTIDLNLGVEYNMWLGKNSGIAESGSTGILRPEQKPNLTFFFQLNNWLHRKNELYYGYRSPGINCLAGVTFRF